MNRIQIATCIAILAGSMLFLPITSVNAQTDGVGVLRQGLVIGEDDRQIVDAKWLDANPRYRALVDAIGILKRTDGSTCTASYIGGGLAITAGHCVDADSSERRNLPCDNISIQWGFRNDAAPYLTSKCVRVLAARQLIPYDYAILEVSPLPRAEIRAVHNAGSSSGVTTPGIMLSHPGGRPLIWSGKCYLPPYAIAVAHECDSEGGSSGALILEEKFLLAVGIHYGHSGLLNSAIYLAHVPVGDIMDARFKAKGKIAVSSGKCLDVTDRKTADRTLLQLWDCSGDSAQKWSMTPFGALVGLEGKCLDAPFSANGTRPWIFGCHSGTNQMWQFQDSEFRTGSTQCLDIPGIKPANSTPAQIWSCHGGDGQKWTWTARQEILNTQGKCLDAASFSPKNGTPVVAFECHGGANQKWDLTAGGAIRGIGGLCLDVTDGKISNGTALQLHECNGSGAQQWFVRGTIRGLGGKCLEASRAHPANGTTVIVDECRGAATQVWNYFP